MEKSYPSPIAFCIAWDLFLRRLPPLRRRAKARPSFFTSRAPALRRPPRTDYAARPAPSPVPPDRGTGRPDCHAGTRSAQFRPTLLRRAGASLDRSAGTGTRSATKLPSSRRRAFRTGGRKSHPLLPRQNSPRASNSTTLILISTAAIVLVAAIFFFARKHNAPPVTKTPSAAPTVVRAHGLRSTVPSPHRLRSTCARPRANNARTITARASALPTPPERVTVDNYPPADSAPNLGTLLVVAGQDDARVFLNGKLQQQLTQAGQLRLPNLELKDYVVQVSKSGFQDPPQQNIHIRKGEQAKLIFNLQPQLRMASLTIQGGAPGTTVLVDQTLVGTIQPDGTLSVSSVSPGDHTVELRKDRFKPRQFKKHFVAGATISLAAADAALEAAPGELTITFAPADATVAIVKGESSENREQWCPPQSCRRHLHSYGANRRTVHALVHSRSPRRSVQDIGFVSRPERHDEVGRSSRMEA